MHMHLHPTARAWSDLEPQDSLHRPPLLWPTMLPISFSPLCSCSQRTADSLYTDPFRCCRTQSIYSNRHSPRPPIEESTGFRPVHVSPRSPMISTSGVSSLREKKTRCYVQLPFLQLDWIALRRALWACSIRRQQRLGRLDTIDSSMLERIGTLRVVD
jgi:hypothetical protein